MYLFGNRRAIITSCNLTKAALSQNYESGIIAKNTPLITKFQDYFDGLWQSSGEDLTRAQVDEWNEIITEHHLRGGRPSSVFSSRVVATGGAHLGKRTDLAVEDAHGGTETGQQPGDAGVGV